MLVLTLSRLRESNPLVLVFSLSSGPVTGVLCRDPGLPSLSLLGSLDSCCLELDLSLLAGLL